MTHQRKENQAECQASQDISDEDTSHKHHHRGRHAGERAGDAERDFWREWRDERHGRGPAMQVGQPLSPKEMQAWREFFHKTFGTWPEEHWIFGGRRFSPWHQGIDSFNPFVASLLSKGGGLLPLYVLHLVAQQPRYGNEIMDLLATRTNGQWVSNPGAIYPLLALLEREGFIKGEWEDPDKRTVRVYAITPRGQEEVARISTIVSPKVAETISVLQELLADLQGVPHTDTAGQEAAPEKEIHE
ncbi:MAG TPA: PadR family transcriptional regulator [Roseiflexaceae bacterium]|nr:PadR family transcriptional regulator [Roseiflexaceae bacterium]